MGGSMSNEGLPKQPQPQPLPQQQPSSKAPCPADAVSILHISDTHSLHRQIEENFPMPEADILIHTGDFTDDGSIQEIIDFNDWLGELRQRYRHIIVIYGNHEYKQGNIEPQRTKELVSNATVLDHESVEVLGLHIYGSPWVYGDKAATPGDTNGHRFTDIPENVDILLTHGSAKGIMDCCEAIGNPGFQWGGSTALRQEILRARPRAHFFGHMHEQRGVWWREDGQEFQGGIEYDIGNGEVHKTWTAPTAADFPGQLISCNAMKNHNGIDRCCGKQSNNHIAGPARLIVAERDDLGVWRFRVDRP